MGIENLKTKTVMLGIRRHAMEGSERNLRTVLISIHLPKSFSTLILQAMRCSREASTKKAPSPLLRVTFICRPVSLPASTPTPTHVLLRRWSARHYCLRVEHLPFKFFQCPQLPIEEEQ